MPLYEYECRQCGAVTDVRHGFKEPHKGPCPACGGALVRRFNPAGIVFKGSGFYKTDSRKSAASDGAAAAKSDGKAEPAAKTDSGTSGESGSKSEPAQKSDSGSQGDSSSKSESTSKSDTGPKSPTPPKSDAAA